MARLFNSVRAPGESLEAHVQEYKIYCIGLNDHIERREDINASDDLDALDHARKICGPHEVEVSQGARLVARVSADGTASTIPTKGPYAH